jgi:pimeloyl-ACP methyl ester carboxylesterase
LRTKFLHLGDDALHYLHTGATTLPGVPPALDRGALFLLVHGGGRNAGDFRRTLSGLEGRHSAVALDLPGHGRSSGLDALPSIEAYADVVERFTAALGLRRHVLVGWSMGALIGLVVAARAPERLAGLVLIAGSPAWTVDPVVLDRLQAVVRGVRPQQFDKVLFSPATPLDVMREAWMEQVRTDPRVLYGDMLAGRAFDIPAHMAKVRIPTLVIHGADDQITSVARAEELARGIAGARLKIVPAAGHIPQLEQPERTNELLTSFVEGLS